MASEFFSKIKQLGFDEFTKSLPSGSYPQTAQSIEWVFAFPQAREALTWLSANLSSVNTLSVEEQEEESGAPELTASELSEVSLLLSPEMFQVPLESSSLLSELKSLEEEQYREISELEQELNSLEEPSYARLFTEWQNLSLIHI